MSVEYFNDQTVNAIQLIFFFITLNISVILALRALTDCSKFCYSK